MSNNHEPFTEPYDEKEEMSTVRVGCYAGYRAEESPQHFSIGKRKIKVIEIIDRWLDPACSYFKVRGDDSGIYILRYDHDSDSWDIILFSSGTRDETRLSST
jgi:hypothetical protein